MDIDIIWLAGLIDGEGCIYAKTVNKSCSIYTKVEVHAASETMIREIASIGAKYSVHVTIEGPKWQPLSTRPTWRATIGRLNDVRKLLQLLIPFLRIKKDEAELVVDFLNSYIDVPISQRPSKEERQQFVDLLKQMKRN